MIAPKPTPNCAKPRAKPHARHCAASNATAAREVYKLLTNPPLVPDGGDLRQLRTGYGLTLTGIAPALSTTPTRLSELKRDLKHNQDLAERYQHHLTQQPEIF